MEPGPPTERVKPRGKLFRKYVVLFVAVVTGALLTNGVIEIYFSCVENKAALVALQQEKAQAAAARIESFVGEIERRLMGVLREYHAEMGRLVLEHEGTLERFTGDGMMIFFNDPVPVPDAAVRAVRMAVATRERVAELIGKWKKQGFELDLGVGIAQRYATIGAIGTVTNLAARLCGEARPGQILVARRVLAQLEDLVEAEDAGELTLKGFHRPVPAGNVIRLRG